MGSGVITLVRGRSLKTKYLQQDYLFEELLEEGNMVVCWIKS
jgi:hypothetical protein